MQVFRLMGLPDKMIGFKSLPKDLTDGLEMHDCTKLGRAWRDFIGKVERIVKVKPELDPITRQIRTFPEVKETAPFAYLIDREMNNDKERWGQIVEYVRRNAPGTWKQTGSDGKEAPIRLMDDLEKMAKPLARDFHSEVDLEPEDMIVIPLAEVVEEKEPEGPVVTIVSAQEEKKEFICDECKRVFDTNQGMLVHSRKAHKKVEV